MLAPGVQCMTVVARRVPRTSGLATSGTITVLLLCLAWLPVPAFGTHISDVSNRAQMNVSRDDWK